MSEEGDSVIGVAIGPSEDLDFGKNLRNKTERKSMLEEDSEVESEEVAYVMEGHVKKGENRAPTQCGCIPIRERRFMGKYAAIDITNAAFIYGKTRENMNKQIKFADIKTVEKEHDSHLFKIVLKNGRRARHKNRADYCFMALDRSSAEEWVVRLQDVCFLKATIYNVGTNGEFPENAVMGVERHTGVCFSGGGARAHCAAVGQLRALFHLGLLNNKDINYISSVSGGSWASTIFTFYQEGASSDRELLGDVTKLNTLHLGNLDKDPHLMLNVATIDMWKLAESLFWSSDWDEWWEKTVGKVYLEPFGLNELRSFTHPKMKQAIKQTNAQLDWNNQQFYEARKKRPFSIINAAVLGPGWARTGDLVPVQFTPMYSGTPYLHSIHARSKKKHGRGNAQQATRRFSSELIIGGGMIDTFAFGTDEPEKGPVFRPPRLSLADAGKAVTNAVKDLFKFMEGFVNDNQDKITKGVPRHLVRVPFPEKPMTLRHAVGISSHAPAFYFKNKIIGGDRLNPKSVYWSPSSQFARRRSSAPPEEDTQKHSAEEMEFADGGTLDNLGLIALLQRGVKRIIVCVNGEVHVPMKPNGKRTSVRKSIRKLKSLDRQSAGDRRPQLSALARDDDDDETVYMEEEEVVMEDDLEGYAFMPTYQDWPDSQILPLFGIEVPQFKNFEWGTHVHNQVFKKTRIVDLLRKFQECKMNNDPLIAIEQYEVMRNDWWGLKGNQTVEILWYYLEKTRSFELQLPSETLEEVDRGRKGSFRYFPNYKTFGTKKGKWVEPSLSNRQASLLAALTEWSFMQNGRLIQGFIRGTVAAEKHEGEELVAPLQEHGFA